MLVLTRKQGEEIILPELGVTICLTDLRGNKARIGITAPDHIRILRRELVDREPQLRNDESRRAGTGGGGQSISSAAYMVR